MNEAAKHTPGPWRWVDMKYRGCVILDSNNEIVATDIYACARVDIELMSAAPEMLEALKECRDAVDALTRRLSFIDNTPMLVVRQAYAAYGNAQAAIAKAEGATNNQQTKGV